MKRRFAILLTAALVAIPVAWQVAEACGDKLLLVGRGVKFDRAYASVYPGNILIYSRPSTNPKAAIRDPKLHKILRQAGHGVSVIESAPLLEQALRTVPVDVVLADVSEAPMLETLASTSLSKPALRFVLFKTSNMDEAKRLQKQYFCPLASGDGVTKYLAVIEETMKARSPAHGAGKK
jgi:hypothetical protein